MLGYLVLTILQIIGAWFGAPHILKFIPSGIGATPMLFIKAAIYALIVWIIGLVLSFVLKDVRLPHSSTLASTLIGAVLAAVILLVLPMAKVSLPSGVHPEFILIAGAILGYLARR